MNWNRPGLKRLRENFYEGYRVGKLRGGRRRQRPAPSHVPVYVFMAMLGFTSLQYWAGFFAEFGEYADDKAIEGESSDSLLKAESGEIIVQDDVHMGEDKPIDAGDEELQLANESNNPENQDLSDEGLAEKLQIEELVDMEKNEYIENVENSGNVENAAIEDTGIPSASAEVETEEHMRP
ncbi:hypothetical protein GUJ93_ZPchr0007g4860 [Zizania palustris]|uniref:Uncharacterized protein n=1 Tax=Zizania palustris TaxID=103762 RepID=A0A8J5T8G0_ZIZPA|nr:hypothetical protein GUJ93_ZPchr0007g4860 [Zizania palustris]